MQTRHPLVCVVWIHPSTVLQSDKHLLSFETRDGGVAVLEIFLYCRKSTNSTMLFLVIGAIKYCQKVQKTVLSRAKKDERKWENTFRGLALLPNTPLHTCCRSNWGIITSAKEDIGLLAIQSLQILVIFWRLKRCLRRITFLVIETQKPRSGKCVKHNDPSDLILIYCVFARNVMCHTDFEKNKSQGQSRKKLHFFFLFDVISGLLSYEFTYSYSFVPPYEAMKSMTLMNTCCRK